MSHFAPRPVFRREDINNPRRNPRLADPFVWLIAFCRGLVRGNRFQAGTRVDLTVRFVGPENVFGQPAIRKISGNDPDEARCPRFRVPLTSPSLL